MSSYDNYGDWRSLMDIVTYVILGLVLLLIILNITLLSQLKNKRNTDR